MRRPLGLAAAAVALFTLWIGWGVAHPTATIVTVYEPYIAAPVLIEPAPSLADTHEPPQDAQEQPLALSAALTTAPRYYDAEALHSLLGATPWPVHLWPDVVALVSCESPAADGADAQAVGDRDLLPFNGPSRGLTQVNVQAWPQYARSYDLMNPHENLLAAWSIYVEAGYSFSPWSCAP